MGRHSAPDRDLGPETAALGAAGRPEVAPGPAPQAAADKSSETAAGTVDWSAPAGASRGESTGASTGGSEPAPVAAAPLPPGSRGDLQLLRTRPRLRASCAGAVVLSFAIFTVVLIVLGRSDVYLIWLWIPIVASGVLVGALLDRAHRSADRMR